MLKRIKLKSLKPNPYRHFLTYEIQKSKVQALTESMQATGFWSTTLLARPAVGGGYELAFGHHRWQAAIDFYGEDSMFEITIEDLDNDNMLQMMARENNEVYDANALQDIELVKAAIEGYANGEIHLPAPAKGNKGGGNGLDTKNFYNLQLTESCKFTAKGLAEYLGTPQWRVNEALGHLRLIKNDTASVDDFKGLSPTQAQELKTQVNKAEQKAGKKVAKKVAETVGSAMRDKSASSGRGSGSSTKTTAAQVAADTVSKETGKNTDLDRFRRKFNQTRDKINGAHLSLERLTDEMVERGIIEIGASPEVRDMLESMKKMKSALTYFDTEFPRKSKLKAVK